MRAYLPLILLAGLLGSGCASMPYTGNACDADDPMPLGEAEPQFEQGRPQWFVDGFGHYFFSLPTKLLLLSWRADNHDVSPETQAELKGYLDANGLCHVKVRVNQYSPGGEWSRLRRNKNVGAGWRYTVGVFAWLNYTIFPQRLFGGDNYNPWTNTINLYSDLPTIALHEGGHAKDYEHRRWRGSYGALRFVPLVPLYQESVATSDALGYLRTHDEVHAQQRGYHVLWGALGSYVAGEANQWVPAPIWITYAVSYATSWTGKFIGWTRGRFLGPDDDDVAELTPVEISWHAMTASPRFEPAGLDDSR